MPSCLGFSSTRCHILKEHNTKAVDDEDGDGDGVDGDRDEWLNTGIAK
jgi:hypothetical protein